MLCWKKTASNLEKSMHVSAFHTQPHQSNKPPTQFTTQPFFLPILYPLNSISLRNVSLIYKRERRKKTFWFQYINCSPGTQSFFFFWLKCEATSQKHGGLLREGKNTSVGSCTSAKMNQKTQLLNQMLAKYENQQVYSKATLHISKTTF